MFATVALVFALALGGLAVWSLTPAASIPIVRMPIPLGSDEDFTSGGRHLVAISPDGRQIVYVADGGLWLRPTDQLQATAITATLEGEGNARNPFFSPDGQWIGYHRETPVARPRTLVPPWPSSNGSTASAR